MAKSAKKNCPCNGYKIEIVPGVFVHSRFLYALVNLGSGEMVTICMNGRVLAPGNVAVTDPQEAMRWRQKAADIVVAQGKNVGE